MRPIFLHNTSTFHFISNVDSSFQQEILLSADDYLSSEMVEVAEAFVKEIVKEIIEELSLF